jgi:excisionase family DNA binding protein
MTDRVLVPLPDGRWLALAPDTFAAGLAAGAAAMTAQSPSGPAKQPDEGLVDAGELAQLLSLPKSCVYEKARASEIPSVRVGKHVRFRPSQVLAALGAAGNQAGGRS